MPNIRFRVLDLFCGSGGAGAGYVRCGAYVLGCDIELQPKNPHDFIQGDWKEILHQYYDDFDLIHASPPCQAYSKSALQWRGNGKIYPDYISELRAELKETGKEYVIENVPGAPLIDPIYLNGSYFGLLVHRPRYFECSFLVTQPIIPETKQPIKMGRLVRRGDIIQPVGHFSGVSYAREQMEIDWMGQKELAQAIPPAYTEYIGNSYLKNGVQ